MTATATNLTSPPPLDVVAYHVNEFVLRSLDEYSRDRAGSGAFEVSFDVQANESDPRDFQIVLNVEFAPKGYTTEQNPPYSIRLQIAGYFKFLEGIATDQMERMIQVNGSSILYGIARGFVGQATGAAKNGQFVLPAVNFLELVNARSKMVQSDAAAGVPLGNQVIPPNGQTTQQ